MSIIGVIGKERQFNQIKKQINKEKLEIIYINANSIEYIKNIKFDIIIIQDLLEHLKEKQEYIKEIIKKAKYLLLNADISINENIFKDINIKILTYGLKQKSTITISSIGENEIIVSVQRSFENIKGDLVEQQEIPVKVTKNSTIDLYNSLIKTAIINIFGTKNR